MSDERCVVVIGGTTGIGKEIARHYAATGSRGGAERPSRRARRARSLPSWADGRVASTWISPSPRSWRRSCADIGPVRYLVLTPILRDDNKVRDFNIDGALNLVTMKLVGYTETVHQLLDRLSDDSAIVLFGGMAKERPYPGSTTVSTVNGGVVGLVRTLSSELAPIRVNAIHPGFVVDSPYWSGKDMDRHTKRTLTGQLPVMAEIVDAVRFLLENSAVNDTNLFVDGGWRPTD